MEADFWHELWDKNETGWHKEETNEFLLKHFEALQLPKKSRIFIPLCGKSVDIKWLVEQGYQVVGVELNEPAIKELFEYLQIEPTITKIGTLLRYSSNNIDIFVGDFFDLNVELLGRVDAIYDRGAIVALPSSMRQEYTKRLISITNKAPQLVITFDYDQALMEGPPFSVDRSLLNRYYIDAYTIRLLETIRIKNFGFELDEHIWLLKA